MIAIEIIGPKSRYQHSTLIQLEHFEEENKWWLLWTEFLICNIVMYKCTWINIIDIAVDCYKTFNSE